jgi:Tol biopolymer transport system component
MSKSSHALVSLCLVAGLVLLAPATGVAGAAAPGATGRTERAAPSTIDDRQLVRSKGWGAVTAAKAYRQTLSKSTKKGATATTKAAGSGVSVTFEFGPRRGKAQIVVGGKVRTTVSTAAAKARLRAVQVSGSGKVEVRVVKGGKGVFLDKVVLTPGSGGTSPFARGAIAQVDATASGAGGNGSSINSASVSPDGKYVAFWSDATNLSAEATDGLTHLYVKALATGAIGVADTSASGVLGNDHGYTGEARVIGWQPGSHELLFTTYANNLLDGITLDGSYAPYLMAKSLDDGSVGFIASGVSDAVWSPDATWIAFSSKFVDGCATNPCPGNTNYSWQLFAWQVGTDTYVPVSADASGALPSDGSGPLDASDPAWSPDSTRVAFVSASHELVPGDTNVNRDVFVKNVLTGAIGRASVSAGGAQADNYSGDPAFAPTGNRLAFSSAATNLVPGDDNSTQDVFVKNLSTGAVAPVSVRANGRFVVSPDGSRTPAWSPDGSRILFTSQAFDLVDRADKNIEDDVYVKDLASQGLQLVSVLPDGTNGTSSSTLFGMVGSAGPAWAPDGRSVFFLSAATNFAAQDNNAFQRDLFRKFLS